MGILNTPIIILNFKTYPQAIGEGAINLSKIVEKVAKETKVNIIISPQFSKKIFKT